MHAEPDAQQRREIAARAAADERTVIKAYRSPGKVRASSRARIVRAARELGIEPPSTEQSTGAAS